MREAGGVKTEKSLLGVVMLTGIGVDAFPNFYGSRKLYDSCNASI
ncbi:hypothetical protein RintRC_3123 [Richelia intracellularis]|nr:hypothetical protein RintRC_3123 [Richelia intracellularis]